MPAAGADFFGNFEKVPVGEFEKKIPVLTDPPLVFNILNICEEKSETLISS